MSGPKIVKFPQNRQSPTVEIQPHPEEVIDVDPQIIAIMKARLAGEPLDQFFSRDDQLTNDLAIERERQKLKQVFGNASEVFGGFSSLEAVKVTRSKLREHQVDRDLLSKYANRKLAGQTIDEADLYAHIVTGCELQPKQVRVESLKRLTSTLGPKARDVVDGVAEHYLADGFSAFGVSKEMIELSPTLREQLKSGEIQGAVNEVLNVLYKGME
jgi:hypothetical protein